MKTGRNGRPIVANIDRLHSLMDAAGLAAIVVRGGQNVTYLGGSPSTAPFRAISISPPRAAASWWSGRATPIRCSYWR